MEQHELQATIEGLYHRYQSLTDGEVATYIPELSKADPEAFGICVVTETGRVFETGDCDRPFTIQSISKPFTYGLALEEFGDERVVVSVDANGPAARAGLKAGDVVLTVDGQPVADATALTAQIARKGTTGAMRMDVKSSEGTTRPVEITAVMTPRLIGLADQGLLVNPILLALRSRLEQVPADSTEAAVIRLNTAVALTRVGAWSDAQAELRRVKLPDGPGVGYGTVQYLLGLCAEALGSAAEAEVALAAAATSDSLVSEDGPPVKELAEAKLAQLRGRAGAPAR